MINKISKFLSLDKYYPVFALFITLAAYAPIVPWLGFFHDEFSMLWFHLRMNDVGLFFEGNRPLLVYIYRPLLYLFGSNYFAWALFSFFTRWLCALLFYWILVQVWPERKTLAKAAGLAFIIYPGFQAQFSAMIYGITFLLFAFFLASIGLCLFQIRMSKWRPFLLPLSLILSFISLTTSEYFFTLEFIRYILIWIFLNRGLQKRLKNLFIQSFPYALLFILAIIWRITIVNNETTYSLTIIPKLQNDFFQTAFLLIKQVVLDIWYASISVWFNTIPSMAQIGLFGNRVIISALFFSGVLFFIFTFFLNKISLNEPSPKSKKSINFLIFILACLIFGGVPFWMAGLPVNQPYFYTRWTIPFMLGSSLLIPFILEQVFRVKKLGVLILAILFALGTGNQFLVANSFRQDQEKLGNLYWQVYWRIPALIENTVLFSNMLDFNYENSDHISSGINFMLASEKNHQTIPYFLFYIPERYQTSVLPEIKQGLPLSGKRYYSLFKGNTSQAIVIDYQPPACMKVLDPVFDKFNPNLDDLTKKALILAKPELISNNNANQLSAITKKVVGTIPETSWCYYFEKADLANQFGNWDEVIHLYSEAELKGYSPRDAREWLPFIIAFQQKSDIQGAIRITQKALEADPNLNPLYCAVWRNFYNTANSENDNQPLVLDYINKLGCKDD